MAARWLTAALLAAPAAPFASSIARAADPSPSNPGTSPSPSGDPASLDVQRLVSDLQNPMMARRDEAARRLLARPSAQSRQALVDALQNSGNPNAQTAVARALAAALNPDRAFIPVLVSALGPNRAVTDAAAQALANFPDAPNVFPALRAAAENAALPEPSRTAVVRAMGLLVDKAAADYLVGLVNARGGPMQAAAADALQEISGAPAGIGPDRQYWQRWWNAHANQNEAQWRADLLADRVRQFNRLRQRHAQLSDDLRGLLSEQFASLPDERRKTDALLGYLNSRDPVIRSIGPAIVRDFYSNRALPDSARERLRDMVGDSDENVRRSVVNAIFVINDREAAPALMTQLPQEPLPDLRQALARTLGRTSDLRAVPLLLNMLKRTEVDDAVAAAQALAEMGDSLRTNNADLARQAADALRQIIDARRNDPALRAACLSALGKLHDPDAMNIFLRLLKPAEDPLVRRAALQGLGALGDPTTAGAIASSLIDSDPAIRLEAAQALANIATFAEAEQLFRGLDPQQEPDVRVRAALWEDLNRLLHTGTVQQLNTWPDRFKGDPAKRLEALYALRDALTKERSLEQLAFVQQNIAEALMGLQPPRTDEAAENIQKALNYWRGEGRNRDGSEATLDGLVGQMLNIQFAARKYTEATAFAATQIQLNPQYQVTVGSRVKQEADQLVARGRGADAQQLIDAALKMSPALDSKYQRDLNDIRTEAIKSAPATNQ